MAVYRNYDQTQLDAQYNNRAAARAAETAAPLILTVGGKETDEFLRQQEVYAEAWHGAGLPLSIVPMPGAQHFSILDGLVDTANPLFKAVNSQILGT